MTAPKEASARRRWRPRLLIGLAVAAGVLIVVGANAHLLHVALTSQPECVAHEKVSDGQPDSFRAARSSC